MAIKEDSLDEDRILFETRLKEILGIKESEERNASLAEYTDKSKYEVDTKNSKVFIYHRRLENISGSKIKELEKHLRELDIARKFADRYDVEVFLLPPRLNKNTLVLTNNKVPDGIAVKVFVEFKNARGSYSTIQEAVKTGVKQTELIVIQVDAESSENTIFNALNGQKSYLKDEESKGVVVILENSFLEYTINKKELTRSSFLSWPGT